MSGPTVIVTPVPTGGAILLQLPDYVQPPSGVTGMAISIATSGNGGLSGFSLVYSGAVMPVYLDVGDIFPQPLSPTTEYVYAVTDSRGTTQTAPVMPAWTVTTLPDQLSQIFIRLLQGAINSMILPSGFARPTVMAQMPINGWPAMPFIVVNLDLLQQSEVQIGEDVPNPTPDNDWTLFANATRLWRVSILTQASEERDYFRDTLLSTFRAMKVTAFSPLGMNVTHKFQAASYTEVAAGKHSASAPGFYGADLLFEIDGVFPTAILTTYGSINQIVGTATSQTITSFSIPPSG